MSKHLRSQPRWLTALLLLPVGLAAGGCFSETSLRSDIRSARLEAYQNWERRRAAGEESETRLKGKLNLMDAVKVALENNRQLQEVLADKDVADGRILESYSAALPNVSLNSTYARRDSLGVPPIGFLDSYSMDLEVVQPVFRGGRISAALRAARLVALFSDEHLRQVTQQVIFEVMKTYYDARLADELYAVNQTAVDSAETNLKYVLIERDAGAKSDFDVLRARVDVANFKADMIRQKNAGELAKAALLKTLGVSQESTVTLVDDLAYEPMKPVFETAVKMAYANRPDLHLGEVNLRLQEEAVRVARSAYFPVVNAFFTRTWAKPDPVAPATDDEWGNSWLAGGQATLTLFDGLGREGRMKQERATLKRRQVELLDAEEQAVLEVRQAILALRNAEELVDSQKLNVEQAELGLELAHAGFREGENTQLEVIDARTALVRARGNLALAVHDHAVARLSLKLAMGILGPTADEPREPAEVSVHTIRAEEFSAPGETPAEDPPAEAPLVEPEAEAALPAEVMIPGAFEVKMNE